ncbi:LamG-like jellyroll fold domain-containing protein [Halomicroarcula sp. GCM10025709]|uniref:LamG-like jellyroll fold domain-containing protein n=1 Tax=Haloarcula TaxID=2237 RepID=UPI0024C3A9C6|nr:LamG-like jellyroll fold domain-containing protein [Halomicroarcula sp. YJ-61-S]
MRGESGIGSDERGMTGVVGNLLLVATVVFLGAVLAIGSFAYLDGLGAPTANAEFTYEQTPAGLEMTPEALSTTVDVQLNGKRVTTFGEDAAGRTVLLPTAPGDRITVVSRDGEQTVLVDKAIDDRSEVGDFIAYYTFESTSGSTLVDRSGNGNDGTVRGNPRWTGDSLRFDGSGDFVEVTGLSAPIDVSEFTVAVAYRTDTGARKQELVEHIDNDGSNWLFELKQRGDPDEYDIAYSVDKASGSQSGQLRVGPYSEGERRVAVGTYDGSEYTVYVDGQREKSGSFSSKISMGDLFVGRDAERSGDFLDGDIYEIRLYYTAFGEEEVRVVSAAMG